MKEEFNWLVFERGTIVAGFVSRDDAAGFVEHCGCSSMKTLAAGANRVRRPRKRMACKQRLLPRLHGAQAKRSRSALKFTP
jgi:hypothetical protein